MKRKDHDEPVIARRKRLRSEHKSEKRYLEALQYDQAKNIGRMKVLNLDLLSLLFQFMTMRDHIRLGSTSMIMKVAGGLECGLPTSIPWLKNIRVSSKSVNVLRAIAATRSQKMKIDLRYNSSSFRQVMKHLQHCTGHLILSKLPWPHRPLPKIKSLHLTRSTLISRKLGQRRVSKIFPNLELLVVPKPRMNRDDFTHLSLPKLRRLYIHSAGPVSVYMSISHDLSQRFIGFKLWKSCHVLYFREH